MVLVKKVCFILVLLSVILAIGVFGNIYEPSVEVLSNSAYMPQIILDAGHGGLTNTID